MEYRAWDDQNIVTGDRIKATEWVKHIQDHLIRLENIVDDTTPQLGGILDTNSKQVRWSKGIDVASAGALVLGTDGNYFDITGTTSITSIGTLKIGAFVVLHFDGVLTLTHNATDLILPGAANITTAAGDEVMFMEYATGDWRCVVYTKADGTPISIAGHAVAAAGAVMDSDTSISLNIISESSAGSGVTIDGMLLKDGTIRRGDFVLAVSKYWSNNYTVLIDVADGYVIKDVWAEVTEAFVGDTTVTVGDDSDTDGFLPAAAFDLGTIGYYGIEHDARGVYLWDGVNNHTRDKIYTGSGSITANFVETTGAGGTIVFYIHVTRLK